MLNEIAKLLFLFKVELECGVEPDRKEYAKKILSLPSGLIAGEHKITIGEALDDYQRIILDCPAYPCVGYFNGERIRRKE